MSYGRFCNSKWTDFHKIFKIFVVINPPRTTVCDISDQKLVWVVNTIGTTNTSSFIKIREAI